MITFHIFSKGLCLKHKKLSADKAASFTKKEYGFSVHVFVKLHL